MVCVGHSISMRFHQECMINKPFKHTSPTTVKAFLHIHLGVCSKGLLKYFGTQISKSAALILTLGEGEGEIKSDDMHFCMRFRLSTKRFRSSSSLDSFPDWQLDLVQSLYRALTNWKAYLPQFKSRLFYSLELAVACTCVL